MNILVVEDDDEIRGLVVAYLGCLKYEVHEAADGQKALDLITYGLRPDVIVSDVQMPHRCGASMATAIRTERGLQIPVVFFSGGYSRRQGQLIEELGAKIYMKPYRLHTVPGIIHLELARHAA